MAGILEELNFFEEVTDELVLEVIDRILKSSENCHTLSLNRRCALREELFHSIRRLDVLEKLLEDENVTEIMINGEKGIFLERNGRLEAYQGEKITRERLEELVVRITGASNRMINEASPLVDARLRDGSRVHVAVSPVALDSPAITIRKFSKSAIGLEDLLNMGSFNREIAEFFKKVTSLCYDNIEAIDNKISENLKENWTITRLSKVNLSILRLAYTEILYMADIPYQVSVNEAVEIAKKYSDDEAPSFINAILSSSV